MNLRSMIGLAIGFALMCGTGNAFAERDVITAPTGSLKPICFPNDSGGTICSYKVCWNNHAESMSQCWIEIIFFPAQPNP